MTAVAEDCARPHDVKLGVTAGLGSYLDDLGMAAERGVTVMEVTFCCSISVAERVRC